MFCEVLVLACCEGCADEEEEKEDDKDLFQR